MTPDESCEAMLAALEASSWDLDTAPYILENEIGSEPEAPNPYALVKFRTIDEEQQTLGPPGDRLFKTTAMMLFELHTPADSTGTKTAAGLIAIIRATYKGLRIGNDIVCEQFAQKEIGVVGAWLRVDAQVLFSFHETR